MLLFPVFRHLLINDALTLIMSQNAADINPDPNHPESDACASNSTEALNNIHSA